MNQRYPRDPRRKPYYQEKKYVHHYGPTNQFYRSNPQPWEQNQQPKFARGHRRDGPIQSWGQYRDRGFQKFGRGNKRTFQGSMDSPGDSVKKFKLSTSVHQSWPADPAEAEKPRPEVQPRDEENNATQSLSSALDDEMVDEVAVESPKNVAYLEEPKMAARSSSEESPKLRKESPKRSAEVPKSLAIPKNSAVESPKLNETIYCRLCNNDKSFKSNKDFATHLTVIHYREKIMKNVEPPLSCLKCNYTPALALGEEARAEELMMHYGCDEGVAMNYYKHDSSNLPALNRSKQQQLEVEKKVICGMCQVSLENERLFMRHITLRHFSKCLLDDLPPSSPYICPFIDCEQEKTSLHQLMLHYGCEHNVSMELYDKKMRAKMKPADDLSKSETHDADQVLPNTAEESQSQAEKLQPKDKKSSKPSEGSKASKMKDYTCVRCSTKKTFLNFKSLQYHILQTHAFPDLSNKTGLFKCPHCSFKPFSVRSEFANHVIDNHWHLYQGDKIPTQPSIIEKQVNKEPRPIQPSTSGIVTKKRPSIEHEGSPKPLPCNRVKKTIHKAPILSARQKVTQNWESTSIDGLKCKVEELEAKLEAAKEAKAEVIKKKTEDFEKWINQKELALEQAEQERQKQEDKLEQSNIKLAEVIKQVEQSQTKIANLEAMLDDKHTQNHSLTKEKRQLEKQISLLETSEKENTKQKTKMEEMNAKLTDDLGSLKEKLNNMDLTLAEKDEEIKELNSNHRFVLAENEKKMKRLEKQIESHKNKIEKLQDEKKEKMVALKDQTKKNKDSEQELKAQITKLTKEIKTLSNQEKKVELQKADKDKFDQIQKDLNEKEAQVKCLNDKNNTLLEGWEKFQRVVIELEAIIQDKNEKMKELSCKLEDTETNLDEALQRLKDQKGVEKEKKDMNRQIKQLQTTLADREARQFNNVKLIASLETENKDLKEKIKDLEEITSRTEEEMYEMVDTVKSQKDQISKLQSTVETIDQDKAKSVARFQSKNVEVNNLKSKNLELEASIRNLEREMRQMASGESNLDQLQIKLDNKNGEIVHLRKTLQGFQLNITALKSKNSSLTKELSILKDRDSNMETEYSELVAEYEILKKQFKGNIEHARHKQLKDFRGGTDVRKSKEDYEIEIKQEKIDVDDSLSLPNFSDTPNSSESFVDASADQIIFTREALVSENEEEDDGIIDPTDTMEGLADIPIPSDEHGYSRPPAPALVFTNDPVTNRPNAPFLSDPKSSGNKIGKEIHPNFLHFKPLGKNEVCDKHNNQVKNGPPKYKPGPLSSKKKHEPEPAVIVEDDETIVCGICNEYDPPLNSNLNGQEPYTTEWVGCDCERWYHKSCTNLQKFSSRFSCRSVKKKCLKKPKEIVKMKKEPDHQSSSNPP